MTDLAKARGIIYGLAIGDALGYPVEFTCLADIQARYGAEGITGLPEPALFTDDTQMSIAIAEALVKTGDGGIDDIMDALRSEFIRWYHSPENNRSPGKACLAGVANMERGIPWRKSGVPNNKGCGAVMRVAPVGYLYQHHPAQLREVAVATGICTHVHPAAEAASMGAAWLVKLLLDGVPPENLIPGLLAFTAGISREFDGAIRKIEDCLHWDDEERALSYLGEGWIGEEALALALYCFLRYPGDYGKTVLRAANTEGDSDSIACIAGSLSGASLGIAAIPENWIAGIEKTACLGDLAERLARKKKELMVS